MSLYDKASIVLIPSGFKSGSTDNLYSVLPANGNGDFNATRGSTATRVNKDGLIESVASNVPRLDYPLTSGVVGDCPHLLLEPSRTNLITYSEDFTQWTNTGSETTDTANAATSPDGSLNSTKLQEANSSFGYHRLSKSITASSGTDYSLSFFAKKGTKSFVQLLLINTSNSEAASKVFDLQNGTVGETIVNGSATLTDSKIEDFGNGWFRCTIVAQLSTTPNTFRINLANAATGNTSSLGMVQYTGDSNGNIFIWGAQLEEASFITSYIPTSGSTVTRSADLCIDSGTSAEFNASEGVLFIECSMFTNSGQNNYFSIGDTTGTRDGVELHFRTESNRIRGIIYSSDSVTVNFDTTSFDKTNNNKIAFKYKDNDFAIWVNGSQANTRTSGAGPLKLSKPQFSDANNGNIWYGKCKQAIVFNELLTDAELTTLTTQ